jgi:hypothetical protein
LERRLDGGDLRGLRVDDHVPAGQYAADDLSGMQGASRGDSDGVGIERSPQKFAAPLYATVGEFEGKPLAAIGRAAVRGPS